MLTCIPTTSLPYIEEITQSHVSSTYQAPPQKSIFARYKEIELKNEALKASTYSEFSKQAATTQHRLLSTFDSEKVKFKMAFSERKIATPRDFEDYKASIYSFDTK